MFFEKQKKDVDYEPPAKLSRETIRNTKVDAKKMSNLVDKPKTNRSGSEQKPSQQDKLEVLPVRTTRSSSNRQSTKRIN